MSNVKSMRMKGVLDMDKEKFENLLKQYIDDGFNRVDIELGNGEIVSFNSKTRNYLFSESHFYFGGNGLCVTIDYRSIKSIAI